jgi:hypothetical protein
MPDSRQKPPPNLGEPGNLDYILDWLERDQSDKKKSYSFYLSKELFDEFKSLCLDKKPSKVLEYLMQAYINAAKARQFKKQK